MAPTTPQMRRRPPPSPATGRRPVSLEATSISTPNPSSMAMNPAPLYPAGRVQNVHGNPTARTQSRAGTRPARQRLLSLSENSLDNDGTQGKRDMRSQGTNQHFLPPPMVWTQPLVRTEASMDISLLLWWSRMMRRARPRQPSRVPRTLRCYQNCLLVA
jgi:hypothetical protein